CNQNAHSLLTSIEGPRASLASMKSSMRSSVSSCSNARKGAAPSSPTSVPSMVMSTTAGARDSMIIAQCCPCRRVLSSVTVTPPIAQLGTRPESYKDQCRGPLPPRDCPPQLSRVGAPALLIDLRLDQLGQLLQRLLPAEVTSFDGNDVGD